MRFSKKILSILLAALMAISMMPFSAITAFAATTSGSCGENATWSISGSTLTISGSGAMDDYADDYGSGRPWYIQGDTRYYDSINTINIGDGITYIGENAFRSFSKVTNVTMPNTVTELGTYAFCNDYALESINIPTNLTTIGYGAFSACNKLPNITLPSSVTSIGERAFSSCKAFTSFSFPAGVETISKNTFSYCTSLESVTIPSSVKTISSYAFNGCTSLESITIPSSVKTIDGYVWNGCSALSTVIFERPSAEQDLTFNVNVFRNCSATAKVAYSGNGNFVLYNNGKEVAEDELCSNIDNTGYTAKTLNWVAPAPQGEAAIGTTVYTTFAEALAAAQTGNTITLLSDVAVDSTIVVNDGKKFTIDTNGKTISSAKRVFEIRHGGVTLTGNGTVSTTANNSAVAVYGSTDSTAADYATFTLGEDTTISAPNCYGAMIGSNPATSKGDAYGAKLTLNGTINSKYGVYINGNVQEPADKTNAAQVTINGTVNADSENAAVYAAGYAKWTVNEDSIISGGSGIYIKSGDLTVNGGTVTATGAETAYAFNPNGANGTGDAIIIDSCGYPGNVPTVAINGGTISSAHGDAVASYTKQDDPLYPNAGFERVTNVIPGTSTAVFSSDVSALASGDYKTAYDETRGGYIVEAPVYVNGVGYPTLAEAIAAAHDGDTITLHSDVTVDSTIVVNDGKKFTIDTNGKTISSSVRVFEIRHGGVTLTGDGTVSTTAISAIAVYGSTNSNDADYATFTLDEDTTISAPNGYGAMIGANSKAAYGAKLTLNGTINSKYGVYINGNVQEPADKTNAAQVTINGTVNADSANAAVYAAGYAKWTVNEGSTIAGGSGIYIKSGDLTVNGGTITATGAETAYAFNPNGANGTGDAIIIDSCGYPGNVPTVAINGGTISSAHGEAVASYTKQDDPLYPNADFEKVTYVIPATSTAVFSSDVSALAEEGFVTNYDAAKGGYVIGVDTAVDTMSITVEDNIDLNIYVADPTNEIKTITYSYNGAADKQQGYEEVSKTVAAKKNADGKINLSVDLAPAQIMDDITVTAKDANGGEIRSFTTSIADYCNTIIQGDFAEDLKDLAKSTLDYGKAASDYFSYNTSEFVGYETKLADPTSAINAISYDSNAYAGGVYAMNKVSYVATSTPELRFYLADTNKEAQNFLAYANSEITCNIGKAKFVKDGANNFILQIKGIDITDFGKQIEVKVGDTTVVKYTPIHWVKAAIGSYDTNLVNLGKGIGNYYLKSVAYFGENE